MSTHSLLILPGDGIGPEVMTEVRKVIAWLTEHRDVHFDVSEDLVGGAAYDVHGVPLHDDTMAKAQAADAVLLGAVGGPKYDTLDFSLKPERGLLRLRKEMDLFANLRPAQCFDALADFSSLKRDVVTEVHQADYADVELSHMYADNGAMQLVRAPKQFDVILTDNLFGDILSDCAAMLTGSLGMLPSASLGAPMENGRPKALYEPVHGSAPDIAGQGKANPTACVLSFAMALRYSFDLGAEATRIETAVEKVLADGVRTADLLQAEGDTAVSTTQMGDAIVAALTASL